MTFNIEHFNRRVVTRLRAVRPGFDSRLGEVVFFSLRHRVRTDSGAHPDS